MCDQFIRVLQPLDNAVFPALRGIAHTNLVDKMVTGCTDPDVVVKQGGIGEVFASIELCSKSGCPLNSKLFFYAKE